MLVFSRSTVNEFPEKARVRLSPVRPMVSVLGETRFGSSRVFSSLGFSEVTTVALPSPVRFSAPFKFSFASTGSALPLVTFAITSPVWSSREAQA